MTWLEILFWTRIVLMFQVVINSSATFKEKLYFLKTGHNKKKLYMINASKVITECWIFIFKAVQRMNSSIKKSQTTKLLFMLKIGISKFNNKLYSVS